MKNNRTVKDSKSRGKLGGMPGKRKKQRCVKLKTKTCPAVIRHKKSLAVKSSQKLGEQAVGERKIRCCS